MDRTKQSGDNMTQWSQKYYGDMLPPECHELNNNWFDMVRKYMKEDGVLHVPDINKSFNKQGEEIQ